LDCRSRQRGDQGRSARGYRCWKPGTHSQTARTNNTMKVPFLDLRVQHSEIMDEIRTAIDAVIDSSAFAGGPFVEEFEEDFATYCECRYAIGVGNGTDALWLSLL